MVALADGAEENWRYFERPVYDQATKIVDHGHASQHLRTAMVAYYGAKSVEGRAEYERLRILLRDQPGGADEVIAALSRLVRGSYGIPGSSLVKFDTTCCFYRLSSVVATDAASLEKAVSYQVLQSYT